MADFPTTANRAGGGGGGKFDQEEAGGVENLGEAEVGPGKVFGLVGDVQRHRHTGAGGRDAEVPGGARGGRQRDRVDAANVEATLRCRNVRVQQLHERGATGGSEGNASEVPGGPVRVGDIHRRGDGSAPGVRIPLQPPLDVRVVGVPHAGSDVVAAPQGVHVDADRLRGNAGARQPAHVRESVVDLDGDGSIGTGRVGPSPVGGGGVGLLREPHAPRQRIGASRRRTGDRPLSRLAVGPPEGVILPRRRVGEAGLVDDEAAGVVPQCVDQLVPRRDGHSTTSR